MCHEAAGKADMVLLSDKTVAGDKNEMTWDILFQLLEEVRASWYLIMFLNENTNVSDAAQLLVYSLCLSENFAEIAMFWLLALIRESVQTLSHSQIRKFWSKYHFWSITKHIYRPDMN